MVPTAQRALLGGVLQLGTLRRALAPTSDGIPEPIVPSADDPSLWSATGLPLLLLLLERALEPLLGETPWQKEALGTQGPWPAPPPSSLLPEEPTCRPEQAAAAGQPLWVAGAWDESASEHHSVHHEPGL